MTNEQLRQFAIACGWSHIVITQPHDTFSITGYSGFKPAPAVADGTLCPLPDFLHSKDAVIEALEWFCEKRGFIWLMKKTATGYDVWFRELSTGDEHEGAHQRSLNEAIILAVLATKGQS